MSKKITYIILLSCLIIGCSNGNSSSSASNNTVNFAKQLQQIQVNDSQLKAIQTKLINYYSQVKPTKTITASGVVVDCVPFSMQPALINSSKSQILLAKNAYLKIKSKHQVVTQFNISPDDCPVGDVAVVRPSLQNLSLGLVNAFNKITSPDLSGYNWVLAANANATNYGLYDLSEVAALSTTAVFNASFNPTMIMPVLDGSHVINQSWWMSYDQQPYLMTLETGLLKSAYFSSDVEVSLFVFSTVSGYGPGPAGGCYNLSCGDFIQYPNTPALGAPIASSQGTYSFTYQAISEGYELDLAYTATNGQNNWNYAIGYYPKSRYGTDDPLTNNPFVLYQAGAEIAAANPIDQYFIDGTLFEMKYNQTNLLSIESYYSPKNSPLYLANLIWNPSISNNALQFYTQGH